MLVAQTWAATTSESPAATSAPASDRYFGVIARSHGTLAFAPCGDSAVPAVDQTVRPSFGREADWLLAGHDGALWVDVHASLRDGVWHLTHLRRAGTRAPRCDEQQAEYVWQLSGEPGWSFKLTAYANYGRRLPGADAQRFRYRPLQPLVDGSYVDPAAAGHPGITLTPGACPSIDGALARSVSNFRATLTWRGGTLEGCAYAGPGRRP